MYTSDDTKVIYMQMQYIKLIKISVITINIIDFDDF